MSSDEHSTPPAETGAEPTSAAEAEVPDMLPSLADDDGIESAASSDVGEDLPDDLPQQEPLLVTPSAETAPPYGMMPPADDIDIDAALAAVASLNVEAEETETAVEPEAASVYAPTEPPVFLLQVPQAVTMKRGSPASVIPAVLLIVSGALLTLATTSGTPVPTTWIAFGATVALAVLLLGYWLAAGRWARGAFFAAILLILGAAVLYGLLQPGSWGAAGAPLFIVVTGVALMLTALLSRPVTRRALLPAILMIAGGLVGLGWSLGALNSSLFSAVAGAAWLVPIVLIVLWLLPLLFRRRA